MQTYSASGGKGRAILDQQEALEEFKKRFEIITQFFQERPGFIIDLNSQNSFDGRLKHVLGATDFVLGQKDGKKRFLDAETALSKSFTLAVPKPEALEKAEYVGFFQDVRTRIRNYLKSRELLPIDN